VAEVVRLRDARRVVSLIGDPALAPTPAGVTDHLIVNIHDIVSPRDSQILAEPSHVESLIEFGRAWDRAQPMVVHCWAGISRSTASAFILACALQPRRREAAIARELRAASATAIPNSHLVTLADRILARDGRMIAAIEMIGRGVPAVEAEPFSLRLRGARRLAGSRVSIRKTTHRA
jgi:predicted protein tyrosine phosphatase